jgi:hypothetical protein
MRDDAKDLLKLIAAAIFIIGGFPGFAIRLMWDRIEPAEPRGGR